RLRVFVVQHLRRRWRRSGCAVGATWASRALRSTCYLPRVTASNKVALVTGSARGLGRAAARRLGDDGWRVHVVWRSGASAPAELVRDFGERIHRADLAKEGSGAALVARVLEIDGRV